ncbi:MAG: Unknown protein [uncultured Sulfurovum sp.]|uniref:Caspase family p20 domain-containing protein n=1 Tax=uncultured Sulfurovum sp. TaxID=269237 RepID=A0A6S6SDN7_9BACT|nr:MAG: Unknown protein [uncultured Sulfurovum sp.]
MRLLLLLLLTLNLLNAQKIALLIGNSQYIHLEKLSSPSKDIPALAQKLRGMNFKVTELYDLDEKKMKKAIKTFKKKLYQNPNAIALFYYSGHGSQAYGESYLIPVDGDTRDEADVEADGVKVETIARKMANAKTKANILFLDACRDVPTGTMGGTKGLGQVNRQPSSTLILYSTSKNKTAKDDRVFNKTVLEKLALNMPFASLANDISYAVGQKTNKKQVPELLSTGLPIFHLKSDYVKDGIFKEGLNHPRFNNFKDSYIKGETVEGITDERRFFVLRNENTIEKINAYTNQINVKVGDIVYGRSYIHNNGTVDNKNTTATEVQIGMPGFSKIRSNIYESDLESDENGNLTISQFISTESTNPKRVTDDAIIHSIDGKKFKLVFVADVNGVQANGGSNPPSIDPTAFIQNGVGKTYTVKGGRADAFYLWTTFQVVEVSASDYDLEVTKTIGTVKDNTNNTIARKNLDVTKGETVVYQLAYTNKAGSIDTPSGTKIYDKYDKSKLEITSVTSRCTNNVDYSATHGLITCEAYDLAPTQTHAFKYSAKIKDDASGIIVNSVEIIPDNNSNPNDNRGKKGSKNRTPNDFDINAKNDDSSATLTITDTSVMYDLEINKTVGNLEEYNKNHKTVIQKKLNVQQGETIVYQLSYGNKSTSVSTPSGTKIYDKYDKSKLEITSVTSRCTNDADYSTTHGLITCEGYDLTPGEVHVFKYVAQVKNDASGTIVNSVEIIPDNNSNLNDNRGKKGSKNRTPNDFDINGVNDNSISKLIIMNKFNNFFHKDNQSILFLLLIFILSLIGLMIVNKRDRIKN